MEQEVRIKMDISITIDAKYDAKELEDIIRIGAYKAFPNNSSYIHALKYAEEADIYSTSDGEIRWSVLFNHAVI